MNDIETFSEEDVDFLRLWLRWLDEDPELSGPLYRKKLMINGTVGSVDETRNILNHEPDWILIDDIVQLRESIKQLTGDMESEGSLPQ